MNRPKLHAQTVSLVAVLAVGGCSASTPASQQDSMTRALAIYDEAVALIDNGKYELAIRTLHKAVQIDQKCFPAHYQLGWIHATCPEPQFRDGREAIHCAMRAIDVERYFDQVGVKDNRARWMDYACLAAGYAESGEYAKAVEAVDEALNWIGKVPVEDQGVRMRELVESRLRAVLKLYQAGKPLRTHKTALSKLSDRWVNAIREASNKEQFPALAE